MKNCSIEFLLNLAEIFAKYIIIQKKKRNKIQWPSIEANVVRGGEMKSEQ
jgi:hypothetical protein